MGAQGWLHGLREQRHGSGAAGSPQSFQEASTGIDRTSVTDVPLQIRLGTCSVMLLAGLFRKP